MVGFVINEKFIVFESNRIKMFVDAILKQQDKFVTLELNSLVLLIEINRDDRV